jgi:hypothetical protein
LGEERENKEKKWPTRTNSNNTFKDMINK